MPSPRPLKARTLHCSSPPSLSLLGPARALMLCSLLGLPIQTLAHPEEDQARPSAAAGTHAESTEDAASHSKEDGSARDPQAKTDAPKWDIEHPPGPLSAVTLETDEGTWLSLDVSPDGKELVFDLLGDLYTLPITGGVAKSLTQGLSWDMQPRFSPDGRYIAFTSDRSGGDNLWIMKRDGSEPTAVSKENFRLVTSPAWSPDSQYLIGRKHFTAERSLGSGELWIYHRTGGDGLQMTKKPNDQKDVGEPALSPDGQYVYFSQDMTPGSSFEYNKDPNSGIYAIRRLKRSTGELETLIGGPGGAIRPTPSPDGKTLAFIRRIRAKSVLHLYDLESGRETPIFDGLERDQQETWAIHGTYPSMAWTPDSQSMAFWAGGKLNRIDVGTREVTPIPFKVSDTRQVTPALRFTQDVAPERFPVKMVRGARVSPDGKQVVFEALGHLYLRDLPAGPPRRLTRSDAHFERSPTWSRDGKWIAYVSWNDEQLGAVRIVSSRGGDSRVITPRPGHYLEPVFSPDGTQLVYRSVGGGYLVSRLWSGDPGIYRIAIRGDKALSKPERITREGERLHFGAAPDELFFIKGDEEQRSQLWRIELDGSDARALLSTEKATDLRVSPDGRWVAMQEHFQVYVAPFIPTGQLVEFSRKGHAFPVARVSRDAGDDLGWSADATRLYWTLGPTLYSRGLKEAFSFLDGAPEQLPEPPTTGIELGFEHASAIPASTVALVGGKLVTMKGEQIVEDGVVVIVRNRIAAIGPRDQVQIPADAKQIDVKGMTVLPGLVDVHWHGGQGMNELIPQQNWLNFASLAFGVTTAHDPSNDTREIFAASELARAGMIVAPRLFSTGTVLYGAKSSIKAEIDSLEDAISHLRRQKTVGAFSVKSYNQPRRDQRQQVIAAGRTLEVMVVPEGGSTFQHNMTMIVDGHTGIEHAIPLAHLYRDVIQLWSGTQVDYTPTLVVGYGGLFGEEYWYQKLDVWKHPRLSRFVPRETLDARSRRRGLVPEEEFSHMDLARNAKKLQDSGVRVHVGAHGQREGLGAHWELWMLEQGGMTPHQALRAGTLDGARYLGLDKDLGSLEVGKLADIMVIDGDPLHDLRQSEHVRYTILNGQVYDAATMAQLEPTPRPAPQFYWMR